MAESLNFMIVYPAHKVDLTSPATACWSVLQNFLKDVDHVLAIATELHPFESPGIDPRGLYIGSAKVGDHQLMHHFLYRDGKRGLMICSALWQAESWEWLIMYKYEIYDFLQGVPGSKRSEVLGEVMRILHKAAI